MADRTVAYTVEVKSTLKDVDTQEMEDTVFIRFRFEVLDGGGVVTGFEHHRTSCPLVQLNHHLNDLNVAFTDMGEAVLSPADIAAIEALAQPTV